MPYSDKVSVVWAVSGSKGRVVGGRKVKERRGQGVRRIIDLPAGCGNH